VVRQWVEAEILPADKIGFSRDVENAVQRDEDGNLRISWTWPSPTVTRDCQLVISHQQPAPTAIPEDLEALHSASIARRDWDEGMGYVVPFDPEWEGGRIFVWAIVDLGFQSFLSEPFEVGLIKPLEEKTKRWGLFRGWRPGKTAAKTADESAQDQGDVESQAGRAEKEQPRESAPQQPDSDSGSEEDPSTKAPSEESDS
jgi:hypothetical protein